MPGNPLSLSSENLEANPSNFSVEGFLSPTHHHHHHHLGAGTDLHGGATSTPRPPPLVSPHVLSSYSRPSDIYRPATACSQGASPPAPGYNYQCGPAAGGSGASSVVAASSGYPPVSTPHLSANSHLQQGGAYAINNNNTSNSSSSISSPANNNSANSNTATPGSAGVTGATGAATNGHGLGHAPHDDVTEGGVSHHAVTGHHAHSSSSHHPALHQGSSALSSSSVFASMSQSKDFPYPRANSWYLSPAAFDQDPNAAGHADYSPYSGMRDMFQNPTSCQLAAFRTPSHKAYYDFKY